MAHGVPGSSTAARVPGSAMAARAPCSTMAAPAPCSTMAARAPCSTFGPGTGTALEDTCPVSMSLEASRAPTLPPRCYRATLCTDFNCLLYKCVHSWTPVERAPKNVTYALLVLTPRYVQCTDVMQFQNTIYEPV